jgi:hypothetical protein
MAPQSFPPPPAPPQYYPPPPVTWTDWSPPKSMGGRHQEATATVTNTVTVAPAAATTTVSPFADLSGPPMSSSSSHSGQPHHQYGDPDDQPQHQMSSKMMAAAGVVATLVFIALLLGLFCFLCRRSRRSRSRSRNAEDLIVPGRQMTKIPDTCAYIKPPAGSPPPSSSQSSSSIPLTQQSTQHTTPIIISTTLDHSYFTGIDTSDHISLADNQSARSADPDEPPPPYRPRSVPPISRECSVRIADGMLPNYVPGNSIPSTEVSMHNPFDDPDGNVSDLEEEASSPTEHTIHDDHISMVSDLSYQQEPTTTYSTI